MTEEEIINAYHEIQNKKDLKIYNSQFDEREHTFYPSRFKIGEHVLVRFTPPENIEEIVPVLKGIVRAIIFTTGKIRYSITVNHSTMHNIDSACVFDDPDGGFTELDFDNYS